MARHPGVHHELEFVDQPQLGQRQRKRHASQQQSLTRLLFESMNCLSQIPSDKLRISINPLERARHNVHLLRVDVRANGSIQGPSNRA